MNTSLILQYVIIAFMVWVSVWVVLKKQFPGVLRHVQGKLAQWLIRPQRSAKIQALGRRLAPSVQLDIACTGCHTCSLERTKQH